MKNKKVKKISGILLPISALSGPYGIGDLGDQAYSFIDWLHRAKQHRWQILPLTIPDITGSPYSSLSGEAGNWLLISPDLLRRAKLLSPTFSPKKIPGSKVPYRMVIRTKWQMVRASYSFFTQHATKQQQDRLTEFCDRQSAWLDAYVLFQALKDRHQQRPWWSWETKWRDPTSARRYLDASLRRQMRLHAYAQWLWAEQWHDLHAYARRNGIQIIGDVPFFVRTDSVDVWAHRDLFILNKSGLPAVVAGVPPDYFSRDGQLWGNPLYRWSAHQQTGFTWWIERMRILHQRCDLIRFDHFRGLNHTWQVRATAKHARRGRWVDSPGQQLLRTVKKRVPHLNLIAEDLGSEPIGADSLRRQFHIPTIRVMLFGWNGLPDNPHDRPNITPDVVYYTSMHDTNTALGWWRREARPHERRTVRARMKRVTKFAEQSIELAWSTPAQTTIAAIQDVLSLGAEARLNRPGKQRGNWAWRLAAGQLTRGSALRLARISKKYGRA